MLNSAIVAGTALWALALCWGFSPINDRLIEQLNARLVASQSKSAQADSDPSDRENAYYSGLASLIGLLPFLLVGGLMNAAISWSLGESWGVSSGVIACMGGGVYELGRRDSQPSD